MSLSLYDVTIPAFIHAFEALDAVLAKGEAFICEKGIAADDLLGARLIDDMLGLVQQVQRASDTAKLSAVRLSRVENEKFADEEKTFADLHERIAKTVRFLKAVPRDAFEKHAAESVEMTMAGKPLTFDPVQYVIQFALPNFYFHITTAYGILRHRGVQIGKRDFLHIQLPG